MVRGKRRERERFLCLGWEVVEEPARNYIAWFLGDPEQTLTATAYPTITDRIFKANKEAGRTPEQVRYLTLLHLDPEAARREAELSRWEHNWVDPWPTEGKEHPS